MKMKKSWMALAAMTLALCGLVKEAGATTQTLNLLVTPSCSRSLTVATAGSTPYDFGASVAFGGTTASTRAVVVTNGSGCSDSVSLNITANTGGTVQWSSNDVGGATTDKYNLYAAFATVAQSYSSLAQASNQVKGGGAVLASGSQFFGNTNGGVIVNGVPQNVWFGLALPTAQTDSAQEQRTITTTFTSL